MNELLSLSVLPLVLTLLAFRLGQVIQQKAKSPLLNPILVAVVIIVVFLLLTGMPAGDYQAGMKSISWLLTPATVCLAIPMYEQLRALRKNLPAIAAGVCIGAVSSLVMVLGFCLMAGFEQSLTLSLLPKSITTAIGAVLAESAGGIPSLATAAIIFSGIFANILGTLLCRLFRISGEVAQGVAFGTAGHVIATTRANELSSLTGAVSSLSLVAAGLLTAVIYPLFAQLV